MFLKITKKLKEKLYMQLFKKNNLSTNILFSHAKILKCYALMFTKSVSPRSFWIKI